MSSSSQSTIQQDGQTLGYLICEDVPGPSAMSCCHTPGLSTTAVGRLQWLDMSTSGVDHASTSVEVLQGLVAAKIAASWECPSSKKPVRGSGQWPLRSTANTSVQSVPRKAWRLSFLINGDLG